VSHCRPYIPTFHGGADLIVQHGHRTLHTARMEGHDASRMCKDELHGQESVRRISFRLRVFACREYRGTVYCERSATGGQWCEWTERNRMGNVSFEFGSGCGIVLIVKELRNESVSNEHIKTWPLH
jgi:hypothetical protein